MDRSKRKLVAVYPYLDTSNDYIVKMRNFIKTEYTLIDYLDVRRGLFDFGRIRTIYMNWIENRWDEKDFELLQKARRKHVNIVWVFHNRVPHDSAAVEEKIEIIKKLIHLSDHIVIHSRASAAYLFDYEPDLNPDKIHMIPHVNYFDTYYNFAGDIRGQLGIGAAEVLFALLGMIKPYKNIELLLEVFEELDLPGASLLIAGRAPDNAYFGQLSERVRGKKNIIIKNRYINNLCMDSYLKAVDVMILPYNIVSSINSGAMIMAFSSGVPVIVPDIAMASEFNDAFFYKYEYSDQAGHKQALKDKVEEAFHCGQARNAAKGEHLKAEIEEKCVDKYVSQKLMEIV